MRNVTVEELVLRQDRNEAWKRYQVTYPEASVGNMSIKKFDIDQWDPKRLRTIRMEGIDRDPGRGSFHKLVEAVEPSEETGWRNELVWMSDTRAEIFEHAPVLEKLFYSDRIKHKRVLINGLGLGVVVHAALTYDSVDHVDVVEHNADVIELVGQFVTADPRVTIWLDDAYDKQWPPGARWDLIWHDIWPSIDYVNLPGMDRLLAKYKSRAGWQGCWQRKGCLSEAKMMRQMKAGTLSVEKAIEYLGGKASWVK